MWWGFFDQEIPRPRMIKVQKYSYPSAAISVHHSLQDPLEFIAVNRTLEKVRAQSAARDSSHSRFVGTWADVAAAGWFVRADSLWPPALCPPVRLDVARETKAPVPATVDLRTQCTLIGWALQLVPLMRRFHEGRRG